MADGVITINTQLDEAGLRQQVDGLSGRLDSMMKGISFAAVGAGVAFVANKVGDLIGSTVEASGHITDMSQRLGMSMSSYQEWSYIMNQNGMDIDNLNAGMVKFNTAIIATGDATSEASGVFKQLGVSIDSSMSRSDIFDATISKLANMGDSIDRTRMLTTLFGKGASQLVPILNSGSASIEQMKQQANDLGLVMSDSTVAAGDNLGDAIDTLKASFSGLMGSALGPMMPMLTQLVQGLTTAMPGIMKALGSVFGPFMSMIMQLMPIAMPIFQTLFGLLGQLLPPITQIVMMLSGAFLQVASAVGQVLISAMPTIMAIISMLMPVLQQMISLVLPVLIGLIQAIAPVIQPLLNILLMLVQMCIIPMMTMFMEIYTVIGPMLIQIIMMLVQAIVPVLNALMTLLQVILPPLMVALRFFAEKIMMGVMIVFKALAPIIMAALDVVTNVLGAFIDVFTGNWDGAWQHVKKAFIAVWDSIKLAFAAVINVIIGGLNGLIRALNKLHFKMPDWLGGGEFSFNLKEVAEVKVKTSGNYQEKAAEQMGKLASMPKFGGFELPDMTKTSTEPIPTGATTATTGFTMPELSGGKAGGLPNVSSTGGAVSSDIATTGSTGGTGTGVVNTLQSTSIYIDVSDNNIAQEIDINSIGDALVGKLKLAGVLS